MGGEHHVVIPAGGEAMSDWTPPNPEFPPPKADEPPLNTGARTGDQEVIRRLVSQGAAEVGEGASGGSRGMKTLQLRIRGDSDGL